MKQEHVVAHKLSFKNKSELEKSKQCGCYFCLNIFNTDEIEEYTTDGTGICPKCSCDSLIPDSSGLLTIDFLENMNTVWFETSEIGEPHE